MCRHRRLDALSFGEDSRTRIRPANTHIQQLTSSGFEPDMGVRTELLLLSVASTKGNIVMEILQRWKEGLTFCLETFPFRESCTRADVAGDKWKELHLLKIQERNI